MICYLINIFVQVQISLYCNIKRMQRLFKIVIDFENCKPFYLNKNSPLDVCFMLKIFYIQKKKTDTFSFI